MVVLQLPLLDKWDKCPVSANNVPPITPFQSKFHLALCTPSVYSRSPIRRYFLSDHIRHTSLQSFLRDLQRDPAHDISERNMIFLTLSSSTNSNSFVKQEAAPSFSTNLSIHITSDTTQALRLNIRDFILTSSTHTLRQDHQPVPSTFSKNNVYRFWHIRPLDPCLPHGQMGMLSL